MLIGHIHPCVRMTHHLHFIVSLLHLGSCLIDDTVCLSLFGCVSCDSDVWTREDESQSSISVLQSIETDCNFCSRVGKENYMLFKLFEAWKSNNVFV